MKIEGDYVVFSSGRREYANRGILGMCDELYVHYGYDGGFPDWGPRGLTKEERQELADYMIALWAKFREADGPIED